MHLTNIFMQLLFTTTAVHSVVHSVSSVEFQKGQKKNLYYILFFYITEVNYDQVLLGIKKRQNAAKSTINVRVPSDNWFSLTLI